MDDDDAAERQRPAWVDAYARAALEVDPDDVPRDWMWARSAVILAELNAAAGAERGLRPLVRRARALPGPDRRGRRGGAVLRGRRPLPRPPGRGHRPSRAGPPAPGGRGRRPRAARRPALAAAQPAGAGQAAARRPGPARPGGRAAAAASGHEAERLGLGGPGRHRGRAAGRGRPAGPAEFRRAGAAWTLGYAGRTVRLPDAKGMRDLAVLLSRPGQPVPAAELVALSGGGRPARAGLAMGADAVLDDQAKQAYRRRLQALDREVADAEDQGDPDRVEKARAERDAIAHELAAALGLGGRDRGLGDPSERARKAVTERIRYSMARIAAVHPELAAHLEASVTTGSSCAYVPAEPVTWLT